MLQIANIDIALGLKTQLIEDKIIELRQLASGKGGPPVAIALGDEGAGPGSLLNPPPYANGEVIIRGNTIRLVDGITDPTFQAIGISIQGAKKALVYDNLIDLPPPSQLRDWRSGDVPYLFSDSESTTSKQ